MNKESSDHTNLTHALLIKDLMPERELRVGDRVWCKRIKKYGTVIRVRIQTVMVLFDDYGEYGRTIRIGKSSLARLFTFSEIWEELPCVILVDGYNYFKTLTGTSFLYLHLTTYANLERGKVLELGFYTPIPANAAAEMLAWVRKEKR